MYDIKSKITPNTIRIFTLLVLIFVYSPSIFHLPRADHWNVLLHTLGTSDLTELIKKSYSYARQSLVAPGDVVLFRPIQSSWLAIEKYLFDANSILPQIISLSLHISIFILLNNLSFLWIKLIDENREPRHNNYFSKQYYIIPIVTSFFILNFSVVEAAIWAHLKGYLFFFALVLIGLLFCSKFVSRPNDLKFRFLLLAWITFLIAAFTYEFGQFVPIVVGVVFGALLFRLGNKKWAIITAFSFTLIFIIYRHINYLDYNLHTANINYMSDLGVTSVQNIYNFTYMIKSFFSVTTLKNLWNMISYFILTPFFPLNTFIHAAGKVYIVKTDVLKFSYLAIPSYIFIFIWFYIVINGLIKAIKNNNIYFKYIILLLFALFFTYISVAALGRMNQRADYAELAQYSYYIYMGLGFFTLLSALAIYYYFQDCNKYHNTKKSLLFAFTFFSVVVTAMNTFTVYKINKSVLQYQTYLRNVTGQIGRFINDNQNKSNLKFAFDLKNSDYMPICPGLGIPMVYLFFYKYINSHDPEYIGIIRNKKVTFYKTDQHNLMYGSNNAYDLILKKVVDIYKIYESKDHYYYGIPGWYLTYDPTVENDPFFIKDKNIDNVIKKIPSKMKILHSMTRNGTFKAPLDYAHHIIEKDYKGFNITKHQYWYFAIPKEYGDLTLENIDRDLYKKWSSSLSLDSIYNYINSNSRKLD